MTRRVHSALVVSSVFAICAATLTAYAQDKSSTDPPPSSPARLAGQWRFNKDLSTPLPDESETPQGRPNGGAGGGGRGGGGFGGARGGRGGPDGSTQGGGGESMSRDDLLKARELMRQVNDPATVLNIVVHDDEVTITDDRGTVHKFKTDGKKQEMQVGTAKLDVKTKWDADELTQEFVVGRMKMTESYQVTVRGHMLVMTIQPLSRGDTSGRGGGQRAPIKFVYERAER